MSHGSKRAKASGFLTVLGVVLVLGVILLAVGLVLGWFSVGADQDTTAGGDAKFEVDVTVDEDKIKEDKDALEEEAKVLKERVEHEMETKTVEAYVEEIDSADGILTVTTEDEERLVLKADDADIETAGGAELSGLKVGDKVAVIYDEKSKRAAKISLLESTAVSDK